MKKLLISDDKTVTKIVHDDNSETAIKTVSSCDTCVTEDGTFKLNETDRNKYSVFISDSAGCYMKCNFCYLTLKNMKYKKLTSIDICTNIWEALTERNFASVDGDLPFVNTKYIKLCWMGMGDAFVNAQRVSEVSDVMLYNIMDSGLAAGLDGIDLSTVMPDIPNVSRTFDIFKRLEDRLAYYDINPHNNILVHRDVEFSNTDMVYPNRSIFRLFYSLHSAIQKTRDVLIPKAMSLDKAIPALIDYSENNKYNVIFHHMFIDGYNDTDEEVDALIQLIDDYNLHDYELRILRYNTCEVSTYMHESNHFKDIIKRLMEVHPHIKVQVSAGSEVKAACGQFLTNN